MPVHKLALGPVFRGLVLWDDTNMKEHLQTLPTRQLADLAEDLNLYGLTEADFTFFEQVVEVLKTRSDCPFAWLCE